MKFKKDDKVGRSDTWNFSTQDHYKGKPDFGKIETANTICYYVRWRNGNSEPYQADSLQLWKDPIKLFKIGDKVGRGTGWEMPAWEYQDHFEGKPDWGIIDEVHDCKKYCYTVKWRTNSKHRYTEEGLQLWEEEPKSFKIGDIVVRDTGWYSDDDDHFIGLPDYGIIKNADPLSALMMVGWRNGRELEYEREEIKLFEEEPIPMFTIKDLAEGNCMVHNDGTFEELKAVLKEAFPFERSSPSGDCKYYYKDTYDADWTASAENDELPSQSVKIFYNQIVNNKNQNENEVQTTKRENKRRSIKGTVRMGHRGQQVAIGRRPKGNKATANAGHSKVVSIKIYRTSGFRGNP